MKLTARQARDMGLQIPAESRKGMKKKKAAQDKGKSQHRLFDALCESHGLPLAVPEYPFAEVIGREWRFDWLWEGWLALEIQGGNYEGGRHTRAAALELEYEKLNHAVLLGYSVLFCTPAQLNDGSIFPLVKKALASREEES